MSSSQEIETQFWKSLKSDRTMMLGLDGSEDGHARPMTAQFERERGPIWFFTAKDHAIVQKLTGSKRAIATFASKGHDLFATVHGSISVDTNPATIDRLWNGFVAAWYEGGKDDKVGFAPSRCGSSGNLVGWIQLRRGNKDAPRCRSQGRL